MRVKLAVPVAVAVVLAVALIAVYAYFTPFNGEPKPKSVKIYVESFTDWWGIIGWMEEGSYMSNNVVGSGDEIFEINNATMIRLVFEKKTERGSLIVNVYVDGDFFTRDATYIEYGRVEIIREL